MVHSPQGSHPSGHQEYMKCLTTELMSCISCSGAKLKKIKNYTTPSLPKHRTTQKSQPKVNSGGVFNKILDKDFLFEYPTLRLINPVK